MRDGCDKRRRRWGAPIVLALMAWAPALSQRYAPIGGTTNASDYPYVALTATPEGGDASGRVDLLPVASPFGVAVTADGSQRYRTRFIVRGLPDPSTLGPYTAYVAWVASWFLEDTQRLGLVAKESGELAEVSWSKFRILITAESSPEAREPTGPVVLRGISPSGRMRPNESCNLSFMGPC